MTQANNTIGKGVPESWEIGDGGVDVTKGKSCKSLVSFSFFSSLQLSQPYSFFLADLLPLVNSAGNSEVTRNLQTRQEKRQRFQRHISLAAAGGADAQVGQCSVAFSNDNHCQSY